MGAAHREQLAAAEREADFERVQRQVAEAAAAEAAEAAEKLREKLQSSQRELRSLQDRLNAAQAERRQQPSPDLVKLQVLSKLADSDSCAAHQDLLEHSHQRHL
jgi:transcription elongation GreA/GreB family factor